MTPFETSRRRLIGQGAVTIVVVGGMMSMTACSSDPSGEAYAPWTLWNAPSIRGTPIALVAAAALAANPHDSQPWLFHVSESAIEVFADVSRNLGAMDPFLREMHIGLGCAIENMIQASGANGYSVIVEVLPGDLRAMPDRRDPVRVATVRLIRTADAAAPSPAYSAIPRRHTNRNPYDRDRPVSPVWRHALASMMAAPEIGAPELRLFTFEDGPARAACQNVIVAATLAIIDDAPMIGDSDRWFRRTDAQIQAYRSGPTLAAAGLSPLTLTLAKLVPVSKDAEHKAWLSHTRDQQVATAPMLGIIAVRDRFDRQASVAAGRAWQRLHLSAVLSGHAVQPLNQAMEMADRDLQLRRPPIWERRLSAVIGDADWQPTFSFRAGIAKRPAPPSPRRALRDILMS